MRAVFASLGSLGDLHPLMAVARAWAGAGHEAVVAASRGFERYVLGQGFAYARIRPDLDPEPSRVGRLSHPTRGPERLLREEVFPASRETFEDLLGASEGADLLVVGELLYVAPLVARKRGIAWATAILSPMSFLSAEDPGILAPVPWLHRARRLGRWPHRLVMAAGRHVTGRWARPLKMLRRELGMPEGGSPVFDEKFSPALVLALFPEFFAPRQSDWPASVRQTGFPYFAQRADARTASRIREFLAAGDPPIVFTLGSSVVYIAGDFYREAADAACRLGVRAILLAGDNPLPADLPDTVLALRYAPLRDVFPGAALAVHHGGIGSCAEALRSGKPSLVIPFGYDQPDNAERLRRLGAATVLPGRKFAAAHLAAALRRALGDPSLRTRCAELAKRVDPESDMAATVSALESAVLSRAARNPGLLSSADGEMLSSPTRQDPKP